MKATKTTAPLTCTLVLPLVLAGCGVAELETPEEVNPTAIAAASMPACGTPLASFEGTYAYSNGAHTGTGVSCAGQGPYGLQYQCVELVMRHFKTRWGLRWYGHAKDLLANAPRNQVDVFDNGDAAHPPRPGDMVVWRNGTYGHVALVTGVRPGAVDIIEQNVSGNGRASLPYDGRTIGARWGSWVPAGWAHAKANVGGGVAWDCARSSWNGQQYWTCSGGSRYRCEGGQPVRQDCGRGCFGAGLGRDDLCIEAAPGWSCGRSAYRGQQYWTCSDGNLYRCDASGPTLVRCPAGCQVRALGTDDVCR
ncbi:MAG: CHAP domain-containing protein [Myxococcales bacterium]|nr:CHAP domain-containing protein [Myxococcales bacterium]